MFLWRLVEQHIFENTVSNRDMGGWPSVGFHQPPKFSFLLHFWATFLSCGVSSRPKFSKNRQFFEKRQNFALFALKCRFWGQKHCFFQIFGAFGAEMWGFIGRLRRPKCGIWPPPWAEAPPNISDFDNIVELRIFNCSSGN